MALAKLRRARCLAWKTLGVGVFFKGDLGRVCFRICFFQNVFGLVSNGFNMFQSRCF